MSIQVNRQDPLKTYREYANRMEPEYSVIRQTMRGADIKEAYDAQPYIVLLSVGIVCSFIGLPFIGAKIFDPTMPYGPFALGVVSSVIGVPTLALGVALAIIHHRQGETYKEIREDKDGAKINELYRQGWENAQKALQEEAARLETVKPTAPSQEKKES